MAVLSTGSTILLLQSLAVPSVCCFMIFLAYYSQWLFNVSFPELEPGPFTTRETRVFNSLVAAMFYSYYKTCTIDPGRFHSPPPSSSHHPSEPSESQPPRSAVLQKRWCRKCQAEKPPRAHHCRHCSRCIPRMDHHCPWTGNCIGLQTFPHFLRYLIFANVSIWYMLHLLFARLRPVWDARRLPAYLGPTFSQMAGLAMLSLTGAFASVVLGILLGTTLRGWALNMTLIEGWEAERYEAVLDGYASGDGDESFWDDGSGAEFPLEHVEYPYDLGFFANMAQAMGATNPLLWFWPFAQGPRMGACGRGTGWEWEENGFNPRPGMWPPVDPAKLRRARLGGWPAALAAAEEEVHFATTADAKAAFARRQEADMLRRRVARMGGQSGVIAELEEPQELGRADRYSQDGDKSDGRDDFETGLHVEPGWMNSDGDRLHDYGVDEDAEGEDMILPLEDHDDENVPIAELLRRRDTNGAKQHSTMPHLTSIVR